MNKAEWVVRRAVRRAKLTAFRFRFRVQLAEVAAARAVLARYARLIRVHDQLEERVNCSAPEDHVRCQAVHNGRLICDEIAEQDNRPGWVMSLVGNLYYCPKHVEHVTVVDRPTEAATSLLR